MHWVVAKEKGYYEVQWRYCQVHANWSSFSVTSKQNVGNIFLKSTLNLYNGSVRVTMSETTRIRRENMNSVEDYALWMPDF